MAVLVPGVIIFGAVLTCTLGQPFLHVGNVNFLPSPSQSGQGQNLGAGGASYSINNQVSQGAVTDPATPATCDDSEKRALVTTCISPYARTYLDQLQNRARQLSCSSQVLSCSRTQQLTQCLNNLPVTTVTNKCWPMVPGLISRLFNLYRIPCTFEDFKRICGNSVQDLLTAAQRTQQASGTTPPPLGGSIIAAILSQAQMGDGGTNSGSNGQPGQAAGGRNTSPQLGGGSPRSQRQSQSQTQSAQSGQTGQSSAALLGLTPQCSRRERHQVFFRCARRYGYAHYRRFGVMRASPTCRADLFDCRRTHQLIGCLNSLPVQRISHACWMMIPDVLTSFLRHYRIPCSYTDIAKRCENMAQSLTTLDKRIEQQGTGLNGGGRQRGAMMNNVASQNTGMSLG